jgi:UDP-2,3-diacylglucosamine hydrolase
VGGNHDFWAGGFLERHIGVTWHSGPFEVESQGRRLYLAHGDGLAPGDGGYRVIRKVFRSRWAISAYRMIHPDLGIPLATRSSRASRHYTESTPVDGPELWRRIAEPQFARGFDAVLIGHFHKPVHVRSGGNDFVINGDLFRHWSYTVLSSGSLELRVMGGRCISPIII